MARTHVRILPFRAADGPHNMAADEVLLLSAVSGQATLRFYTWSTATASLGYFQSARLLRADPLLGKLPYVRRPSGGATLVHHFEVTYALAVPAGDSWQGEESWLARMHRILSMALAGLGVGSRLHCPEAGLERSRGLLCFQQLTRGDILIESSKIVGSAQRKQRGALMQHGGILLARSPYAPALPGIKELSGIDLLHDALVPAAREAFIQDTGWELVARDMDSSELQCLEDLKVRKYGHAIWNDRR
jgi:lipoate-protein ligase A